MALDLAELDALRLKNARISVPLSRTYSLARDLPLAFGQLKANGRCTFTLTDDDLLTAHPGTFAHRIRAVDVFVEAPGTVTPVRGILTNSGFSLLRRVPSAERVPLLRFADAFPVSGFHPRTDMTLRGISGEQLLPFEGTAFTTTWTLEIPAAANAIGMNRVTDVRFDFDIDAAYEITENTPAAQPPASSRSMFVSALALDSTGLATLHDSAKPIGKVRFALDRLALPSGATLTNLAVLVPGVDSGTLLANLGFGDDAAKPFQIIDGLAMSNNGVLGDSNPANALPLNALASGSASRIAILTITKGDEAPRIAEARDVLLWIEYEIS